MPDLQGRTDRYTDGWKAWFCFEDLFVALGAAITAPSSAYPVVTTIDQRLAVGLLTAGPGPDHPGYVHHGRIGYVPLAAHESVFATDGVPHWLLVGRFRDRLR